MVSVDRVYQTVLTIVNKEGMNDVTPQEFNLLANQAQIEIFEEYFQDQARAMLNPSNDGDYSDSARNIEEKINFFDNTYLYSQGDQVDLSTVNPNTNSPGYFGFLFPAQFYRLGRVQVEDSSGIPIIADEVSHKELAYVRRSPLTAPTATQPVYVRHEGGFRVFPLSVTSGVEIIYIRRPSDVKWMGGVMAGQFIEERSVNFELHPSEFPELVVKILGYIGLLIKQQDVQAFAQAQEVGIEQNEQ